MHDLGTIDNASGYSVGYGINASGQIVGVSQGVFGDVRAFLYTPADGMVELNTLLPIGSGWGLDSANAINDAGQITGSGTKTTCGPNTCTSLTHAYVLTPAPPPLGATITGTAVAKPPSGTANAVFTITFNNSGSQPVAVNFNTVDGTALAGADYLANSGTLMFAPGVTTQPVTVQIVGGAPNPSNLSFSVLITNGSPLATGVGFIVNPPHPAQIAYTLSASPSTLSLTALSDGSSVIALASTNGVSENANLTVAWQGTPPSGVALTLFPPDVSIPPQTSASALTGLSIEPSALATAGSFDLRVTATSTSGVTKYVDVTVIITASTLPPSCCTSAGPFVAPAPGINLDLSNDGLSSKGKYKVVTSGGAPAGLGNIQVIRVSDQKIMVTAQTANWGFSPDEDRFVTTSVQDPSVTSIHYVTLYDLTRANPQDPIWTSEDATHNARIQFSPSGNYLFYTDVVGGPRTQLALIDAHTGTVEFADSIQPFGGAPVQGESGDSFGTIGWGFGPKDTRFVYAYLTASSDVQWNLINLEDGPGHAEVKNLSMLYDTSEFWQFSSCGEVIALVRQSSQQQFDIEIYNTKDGTSAGPGAQFAGPVQMLQLHTTATSYVATNNIASGSTDYTLGANNPACTSTSSTPPPPPAPGCCTSAGPFVAPAPGINLDLSNDGLSSKGKYKVVTSGGAPAGLGNIQVIRVSDQKIMVTAQTANWGFSPDEDRFVTTSVQDPSVTSIHYVTLYDLTRANPQDPIWTSEDATHNARIQFSPSGNYLFYTDVVGGPRTQLALIDAHTGTVEFADSIQPFGGAPVQGESGDSFGTIGWGFGPKDTRFVYAYLTASSDVQWNLINLEDGPGHAEVKNLSMLYDTSEFWQFSSCGEVIALVRQSSQQQFDIEIYNTKDGTSAGSGAQFAGPVQMLQLSTTSTSHVATNNTASASPVVYTLAPNIPICSIVVQGHSPIDILLIDDQGRRCGFDSGSGTVVNEIPGGSYSGPGTEPETITIPYGMGTYQIEAYGLLSLTAPAPFRLSIATTDDTDTTDEHDIAGTASSGTLQQFVFTVDGNLLVTGLSPVDKTPPVITPSVTGTVGSNGWYVSDVAIAWNVADGESPIQSSSGCGSVIVSSDTAGTTFTCTATSAGGTASNSITVKRDTAPPKVACGSPDGQWHASDVGIPCTASDSGSGLAGSSAASFALTTAVPAGTETANASTGSLKVCDVAGNCANAGPIAGNMIDKKAPAIALTTPGNGAVYSANQAVNASYSCSDAGSGVANCAGTVANGARIDTAPNGITTSKSFTVKSVDKAGNAVSQVNNYVISCHYVAIGISPSTVARKGVVTVSADVMSCTSSSQSISVKFELTGPQNSKTCGSTKTLMFTTPTFTIPPKTSKAISFPFIVPKTMSVGTYSVTSTTLINGKAVDTTTATLTVQ